jgi:putative transposase
VLLKREGWPVNGKRIYKLYKELGLQLRNKTPKRKVKAKLREDRQAATRANDIWAMDFLHDQLFDGRKIRIPAVIDLYSRFSPALDPRFSYRATDVVGMLDRAAAVTGYPRTTRVDNGPEFVSRDLDLWAFQHGVTLDLAATRRPPGQPAR